MCPFNFYRVSCLREIRATCDTELTGLLVTFLPHILSEVAMVMASSSYTGCD